MRPNIFKVLVALFVFLSLLSAQQFGSSIIKVERTWVITASKPTQYTFEGFFIVNNSNQQVLNITTTPEMDLLEFFDGSIKLHYSGSIKSRQVLHAVAFVKLNYDTNLTSDIPLIPDSFNYTNLTRPNSAIADQAGRLSNNLSTLKTIHNMVEWTHNYIQYDSSYFALVKDAPTVYSEKKGVCVEYSHLLMSLAHSVGIKVRYVGGYVHTTDWQPHAWTEFYIPQYGWLPADATFNQIGILDNSHVMFGYGEDQSYLFDKLTISGGTSFSVEDNVSFVDQKTDLKGVSLKLVPDNKTYTVAVELRNNRSDYVFGSYFLKFPESIGHDNQSVVLLEPGKSQKIYYGLNSSYFKPGYSYLISMKSAFNDAVDEKNVTIVPFSSQNSHSQVSETGVCAGAFILIFLQLMIYKFR